MSRTRTLAAALLLLVLALSPGLALAQAQSGVYLSFKQGLQNPGSNSDTLFKDLEADYGPLQGDRSVESLAVEVSIFQDVGRNGGIGLGLEGSQYIANYAFRDDTGELPNENLAIQGRSLLYTLRGYLRWGWFLPYFGMGTGNYYMDYHQETERASFLDSAPHVFSTRLGFRLDLGTFGLLYEVGNTRAPVTLHTAARTSTLELGGSYQNVGLTYTF